MNERAAYDKRRRSVLHTPTVPTLLREHALHLRSITEKSITFVGTPKNCYSPDKNTLIIFSAVLLVVLPPIT